jgi:NADH-quinone oxidoreductase subunit J
MVVHSIFFYFFSFIAVIAAIMVTRSKNTVHGVFFLILDFISVSCLFIMIGAEFLGMIMLIVYVGAVAVLFLFVVMMLNVNIKETTLEKVKEFRGVKPIGILVGVVIFLELIVVIGGWKFKENVLITSSLVVNQDLTNTESLGNILYTDYVYLFQISGLILLVAMIGAIVLTYRKKEGIKRQNVFSQISREKRDSVTLAKVKIGEGVKIND